MSATSTLPRKRTSWVVLSAVALLTGPASYALAAKAEPSHAPRVQDNAKLFSDGAVSQANGIIADIYANTKTHKQVVVETYTELPPGYTDAAAFGKSEFDKRDINGVLVLIVKKGGALKIFVDKTTDDRFTVTKGGDRDQMGAIMYPLLKDGKSDKALIDGLNFAAGKLKAEFPPASASTTSTSTSATGRVADSPSSGLPTWAWVVIGVLAFFLVIRILGALFGGGGGASYGPGYGGGYGGGGGGGFMSGLMGGLFGAVAGNWLYNQFGGGGSSYGSSGSDSYGASGGGSDYNPDAGNASDDGGNFGGGGGDFGGGGGGGDFGGGGGGGDFGGGGGGGDFGGGGGGDFGGGGGGGDFGGGGD